MGKYKCSGNFHGSIREKNSTREKKILRVFFVNFCVYLYSYEDFSNQMKFSDFFHGLTFQIFHLTMISTKTIKLELMWSYLQNLIKKKMIFELYRNVRCNLIKNKWDFLSKINTTWPLSTQQNKDPTLFPLTEADWLRFNGVTFYEKVILLLISYYCTKKI